MKDGGKVKKIYRQNNKLTQNSFLNNYKRHNYVLASLKSLLKRYCAAKPLNI